MNLRGDQSRLTCNDLLGCPCDVTAQRDCLRLPGTTQAAPCNVADIHRWEARGASLPIIQAALSNQMRCDPTSELTGRGDYVQPSIQSIKLRNTRPALRSNDLFGVAVMLRRTVCNVRSLASECT